MNKTARFIKTSFIYLFGTILTKVISFFLLPLYTSKITPDKFGYYDLTASLLSIIVPVICIEIWSGILRFVFDYEDERKKYKVINNAMVVFSGSIVLYTLGFFGFNLINPVEFAMFIFFTGLAQMGQSVYAGIARGLGKNFIFMISGVISSAVQILTNVLLIGFMDRGVEAIFISTILANLTQILIIEFSVGVLRNFTVKDFDKKIFKSIFKFCLPLSVNSVAFWFLSGFNRVVISNVLGMEANGLYGIAGRFTSVISLFVSVFAMSWQELAFSLAGDEDKSKYYSMGINLYQKFMLFAILGMLPLTKLFFPMMVDAAYADAINIVPVYYLGTAASAISNFTGSIFGSEKKTNIIFVSTVAASVTNVIILLVFMRSIGLHAATWGLFLGFLVNIVMRIILLRKTVQLKLDYMSIALLLLAYGIVTVVFYKGSNMANVITTAIIAICALISFKDMIFGIVNKILKR